MRWSTEQVAAAGREACRHWEAQRGGGACVEMWAEPWGGTRALELVKRLPGPVRAW